MVPLTDAKIGLTFETDVVLSSTSALPLQLLQDRALLRQLGLQVVPRSSVGVLPPGSWSP